MLAARAALTVRCHSQSPAQPSLAPRGPACSNHAEAVQAQRPQWKKLDWQSCRCHPCARGATSGSPSVAKDRQPNGLTQGADYNGGSHHCKQNYFLCPLWASEKKLGNIAAQTRVPRRDWPMAPSTAPPTAPSTAPCHGAVETRAQAVVFPWRYAKPGAHCATFLRTHGAGLVRRSRMVQTARLFWPIRALLNRTGCCGSEA